MGMRYVQMYFSYLEPLADLTDEQLGKVTRAILSYGATGVEPELSGLERTAFKFMRSNFDREAEAYEEKIEKLRANGKKGGRPKGSKKANGFHENQESQEEEEKEEDEDKEEDLSSSSNVVSADAETATTDNPFSALPSLLGKLEQNLGKATPYQIGMIREALTDLGAPLVEEIVETSLRNGARGYGYLQAAFKKAAAQGLTSVDQYRGNRGRETGQIVDRDKPSGNDILHRAINRPFRPKRED